MKTAVIILGHGSRHGGAGDPMAALADAVRPAGGRFLVAHAFLQYAPPTLAEAAASCVAQGAERIVVVPYFVLPGAHVARDIPEEVEALKKSYPGVRFAVTAHVGAHPLMAKIVEELVNAASAE